MFVVSNESTKTVREFSISRMISREDLQIHLGQIHQDIADSAPSSPADFRDSGRCCLRFYLVLDKVLLITHQNMTLLKPALHSRKNIFGWCNMSGLHSAHIY